MTEYNVQAVKALSYIDIDGTLLPDTWVVIGFELLEREKGKRKWVVVGKTVNYSEAVAWADRSGYSLPKKWAVV